MQADSTTPRHPTIRVNLLHAHGSPTQYLYSHHGCRCAPCRGAQTQYNTAYAAAHREEIAAKKAARQAAHREKIAAKKAAYRLAHREERAVYSRAYYVAHREERAAYRLAHCEESAASSAAYEESHREERAAYRSVHREEYRAHCINRRAQTRAAPGTHTATDVAAQYERQRGKCFWGRKCNPDCVVSLKAGYHVDHVTPLVKRGSNSTENIVLACPSCNLRKGAKHPMDWGGRLL